MVRFIYFWLEKTNVEKADCVFNNGWSVKRTGLVQTSSLEEKVLQSQLSH